ncbi:MAG: aldo/keto reductase [Halobellus sp.]|uniref:aldo/keto reductase n=1 Tax=Halobellus sp. TaxID=1979212 RepID=UPI0035D3F029
MTEMEYAEAYGARVPKVGLGTWQLTGEACYEAVSTALDLGYRHIDTAQLYENETEVGRAIEDADVDREELFVTTKVRPGNARYDDVLDSTETSLDRLGTDSIDLLLLHWPNPLVSIGDTMDAMDRLVEEGRVANIGVSNSPQILLERARDAAETDVLTNQVQFHPYKPQRRMLGHCQEEGMLLTGYSPLARGTVFDDADVQRIAEEYDRTRAQVVLRWATQHRNVVVIPKSADPAHLEQNIEIFDFKLTSAEVDALTKPSLLKSGAAMLDGMVSELRP